MNAPARAIGVGLFLTGIALGLLYYNSVEFWATELELKSEKNHAIQAISIMDLWFHVRFLAALSFGSLGVALSGWGAAVLVARLKWLRPGDQ